MAVRKRKGSPYYVYDFALGGRRYRGSTGETTRSEALTAEARIRADISNSAASENDWKMRHLAGTYLTHVATGKASERVLSYQIDFLLAGFGKNTRIADITNADVARYIARRRAKVSDSTVNRELTTLRAMLNYARDSWDQEIPRIKWSAHWRKEPPPRDRFLSREEYQNLLAAAHPDLRPIIIFAVATGLRRTNILHLKWADVDLSARLVRVVIKGNKRHLVELRGDAFTVLAAMKKRQGDVFDRTGFRARWDKAVREAGLTDFRFHDLRHTFASWARIAGADLIDIKEALGHSDISVTTRYAHVKPGLKSSAFDLVSAQSRTHKQVK